MKVSDAFKAGVKKFSVKVHNVEYDGCGIEQLRGNLYRVIVREDYEVDKRSKNWKDLIPDTLRFPVVGEHEVVPDESEVLSPSGKLIVEASKVKKAKPITTLTEATKALLSDLPSSTDEDSYFGKPVKPVRVKEKTKAKRGTKKK